MAADLATFLIRVLTYDSHCAVFTSSMRSRICLAALIFMLKLLSCESVLSTDSADVLAMARAEVTATVHDRVLHSGAYGKLATLTFDYFHEHLDGGKLVDVILMLFDKAFEFADKVCISVCTIQSVYIRIQTLKTILFAGSARDRNSIMAQMPG